MRKEEEEEEGKEEKEEKEEEKEKGKEEEEEKGKEEELKEGVGMHQVAISRPDPGAVCPPSRY